MFAVRNEESALDIVQDAMMKLAEKYGDRPPTELPMLFQRILQNTIRDYYRRSKVRSLWTTLLSSLSPSDDEDYDPLETISGESGSYSPQTPDGQLQQDANPCDN
jgi:RNA polymerase sigma-70 factor (ECF subfamily)